MPVSGVCLDEPERLIAAEREGVPVGLAYAEAPERTRFASPKR